MTLKEMLEKRKALLAKADAITKKAREDNNRELTEDEQSAHDGHIAEIDALDPKIDQVKADQERRERQAKLEQYASQSQGGVPYQDPNAGMSRQEVRDLGKFSFVKCIRESLDGTLSGLEKEMAQQASRDAKNAGVALQGVGIPQMVLAGSGKTRLNANETQTVTQDSGNFGGDTVGLDLRSLIDILRENLMVQQMGAQLIGGLVGDVDFPRASRGSRPTEKTEVATADQHSAQFDAVSLRPKRLPVFSKISRQLILQSSVDVEAWLRNHLAFEIASRMDQQAIEGDGSGSTPTGILNATGVGVVPIATDGGAPTREHIVKLEGEVDQSNALFGSLGYLTNPKVRQKLKLTNLDSGSGKFVWEEREELNGYRAGVSTNVPSDLTKGTGTDLSAIIFGNWPGMMIGQWGGLDMLVNPYSDDTEGLIKLNVWTFYDIALERGEMFAVVKDAITT